MHFNKTLLSIEWTFFTEHHRHEVGLEDRPDQIRDEMLTEEGLEYKEKFVEPIKSLLEVI